MPWIKVDDHFDEHPKIAKCGPLGIAMWLVWAGVLQPQPHRWLHPVEHGQESC